MTAIAPEVADPFGGLKAVPSTDDPESFTEPVIDTADNDVDPIPVRTCEICGTELSYSGRGRPPTRCDEHKKSKSNSSSIDKPSGSRTTKAEREAEIIGEMIRATMVKSALIISLADPYDGLAIIAGHKQVVDQAKGVAQSHDTMRAFLLNVKSSGSIAGLIAACLSIALPIAAHHKLIPAEVKGVPIGQTLERLPQILMKVNKGLESATQDMMTRLEAMQEKVKAE